MNNDKGASRGTVAARVNAWQETPSDQHVASTHARPRILSNTFQPDLVVGYGRRNENSFASPASRSSRDGTDGTRGDGRPPVGSSDLEIQSSPSRYSSALLHPSPSRAFIPNSSLTLDGKYDDPFIGPSESTAAPSKKPESEIVGARGRLRPVQERRERNKGKEPENPTMAELGSMLDSAIIEQSSEGSPVKSEVASPRPPLSRSRSTRAPDRFTDLSPRRVERPSMSYRFSNRPGTSSSDYPTSSPLKPPPPFSRSPPASPPQHHIKSRAYSASIGIPDRCSSPVKERAALFESLYISPREVDQRPQPAPRVHLHHKDEWVTIPGHFPAPESEARLHRLKFSQSIDLQSSTVDPQSSSHDTEAYDTARESTLSPVKRTPSRHDHRRAPSRGWPSHTPVSSKTGLSHPQQTEEAASPQICDAHHPPPRPSFVSQKIAQLALAGLEGEQIPSRSRSVANSRSRDASAATAASAAFTETEIREHALNGSRLKPSQLPPLRVPVQEEADNMFASRHEYNESTTGQIRVRSLLRSRDATQTPVSLAMHEKQVAQSIQHGRVTEEAGGPSTPVRGRASTRKTPRNSGYGVEQSFYFSPNRSRSQSKASGRRLTLEINMGTPDREAMEKVVIKADMDVLDET